MRFARVASRAQLGLDAPPVSIEVHLTPGLPAVNVVGMAESTVRESKERVRSAIISSGFKWPDARITINLSPQNYRRSAPGSIWQSPSGYSPHQGK